jgi:acyl-CoA synthetase (AMP-forming)/AMP-acid ligase II
MDLSDLLRSVPICGDLSDSRAAPSLPDNWLLAHGGLPQGVQPSRLQVRLLRRRPLPHWLLLGGEDLQECKFGFTGAAPITVETLEYFGALGIQINEVYGMSECTGATTWSTDECHLWGSCGYAMQGTEVAVFNPESKELVPFAADIFAPPEAEQGEICYRGRHIMMGYLANPALGPEHVAEIEKKTAGAIGAWASYCCPTPDAMLIPAAADAWVHIRCRWVAAFGR